MQIMAKSEASGSVSPEQFERLVLLLGGHIFFQTLSSAVQFDLFGKLRQFGPLTREQIAKHLGIAEKPARILLLGCASLGLVRKDGDHYSNAPVADRYLVRDVPGNLVSIIEWQHHINYRPMFHFYEALRANANVGLNELDGTENTLYGRLTHYPDLERIFQEAMQSISVQANKLFATSVDLSSVRHLVDVGGGNGTNAMALVRQYPSLRATVFDSPSVCEIAKSNIAATEVASRVGTYPGDCFRDSFPTDADAFLFCHFMTIWSEEKNRQLIKKAYEALPANGRIIIFNMMQSNSEDGPLTAALGSPYFLTLATGEGMLYTWDEYEQWLREAGFAAIEKHELPRDHGVLIGLKA